MTEPRADEVLYECRCPADLAGRPCVHQALFTAQRRIERARDALRLMLPLAKGYAAAHPWPVNDAIVEEAEAVLAGPRPAQDPREALALSVADVARALGLAALDPFDPVALRIEAGLLTRLSDLAAARLGYVCPAADAPAQRADAIVPIEPVLASPPPAPQAREARVLSFADVENAIVDEIETKARNYQDFEWDPVNAGLARLQELAADRLRSVAPANGGAR